MILVIGGKGAGKLDYVHNELGYTEQNIADGVLNELAVVYNLQDVIRNGINAPETDLIEMLSKKAVVVCDEVGCGVVPIDQDEREYRETVGRLCCELATRAEKVVRLVCGIPCIIKGE